jgi:pfkB family carbohydrate kinase
LQIDLLIVGHMTRDRIPGGFRLGGTVSYAAVTARRLGLQPAILTRGAPIGLTPLAPQAMERPMVAWGLETWGLGGPGTDLDGVAIRLMPSSVSTIFVNTFDGDGRRTQVVESLAGPIDPSDLPAQWAHVPMVLLGPLARELPSGWATVLQGSLLGITPQGWMREWDDHGRIHPCRWEGAGEFLRRADAVILSREDVGDDDAYIAELSKQTRLLVVTDGWHPVTIYHAGTSTYVPARPTEEVDPTGAGDVFAAAFLIRLAETGDPLTSARFATVTASMSVEGPGMATIPERARVMEWLEQYRWGGS